MHIYVCIIMIAATPILSYLPSTSTTPPFLARSLFPAFMTFHFVLRSAEFGQCLPHDHGFRYIH